MPAPDAEALLAAMRADHEAEPELWWALAIVEVRLGDLSNAATCYENFRDRVSEQLDRAMAQLSLSPTEALGRLTRLEGSLRRCRDNLLAARGAIAFAGLLIGGDRLERAEDQLRHALARLRQTSPRLWHIVAEWMTTVAIALTERGAYRRAVRTLRLALRFSQHEPADPIRTAMIGRDLGSLLDELDRLGEAEEVLQAAAELASTSANPSLIATIAAARGRTLHRQRRYIEAKSAFEEALAGELSMHERADTLLAAADMMFKLGTSPHDEAQLRNAQRLAHEAEELLEAIGPDALPAWRILGMTSAHLGDLRAARTWFFRSIPATGRDPIRRRSLAYIAYLIRIAEAWDRKALFWGEWRLRLARRSEAPPRDLLLLREQCIAVAERAGDIPTVRTHADAMFAGEATMLRDALGSGRSPADWNRLRLAREALSVLASLELRSLEAGASWRAAGALLAGRGLARTARHRARGETAPRAQDTTEASFRSAVAGLRKGEAVLALVSLYPPAPRDPMRPIRNGFLAPRLFAILWRHGDHEPDLRDLGDFGAAVREAEQWRAAVSQGRATAIPASLGGLPALLGDAARVYILGEGSFEALPLRLLLPTPELLQVGALDGPMAAGAARAAEPIKALIAAEMLDDPEWRQATEAEVQVLRAAGPVTLVDGEALGADALARSLAGSPRIHIIAHGEALHDPADIDLDVYRGAGLRLRENRFLTASEVSSFHLDGVEQVVLSACGSAVGVRQHAEGLASMAAGFLDAGANCVVSSLWPIHHEDTAQFMAIFYALRDPPPAALRKAQQIARDQGMPRYCWAAWTLQCRGLG